MGRMGELCQKSAAAAKVKIANHEGHGGPRRKDPDTDRAGSFLRIPGLQCPEERWPYPAGDYNHSLFADFIVEGWLGLIFYLSPLDCAAGAADFHFSCQR